MKYIFKLELLDLKSIASLPNAWDPDSYRELLGALEYGDTADASDNDLKELSSMALTDYEPEEAATIVLEVVFKDQLKKGQVQNMSHEMLLEKLWEEYSDLSLHERLFNAHQLLYDAFPKSFPKPEALRFRVRVSSTQVQGIAALTSLPEANLIRLLVQGMPQNTKIARLYADALDGADFEDASHILWQLTPSPESSSALVFEGISSHYWFQDLKHWQNLEAELQWE